MAWFRLDDRGAFHAKVLAAGNEAYGAWCRAGQWSSEAGTDGFLPRGTAFTIAAPRIWQKLIDAKGTSTHGLIEPRGDDFQIHDFLDYNPSAEEVRREREKRSVAGRIGGHRSGMSRRLQRSRDEASAEASASAGATANAKQKRTPIPIPIPIPKGSQDQPQTPSDGEVVEEPFALGTASLVEAEARYIDAVGEAFGGRVAIRIRQLEREALVEALNTYFLGSGKLAGIEAMARAATMWVRDCVDSGGEKFTRGWSPMKFVEWLAVQPRSVLGARRRAESAGGGMPEAAAPVGPVAGEETPLGPEETKAALAEFERDRQAAMPSFLRDILDSEAGGKAT